MPDSDQRSAYLDVLLGLYHTDFKPTIKGDINRAKDGESLREKYEEDTGENCELLSGCSMLEMMVALAIRCEEQIMFDPDQGDRTALWFWEMFDNFGFSEMNDDWFNEQEFYDIIWHFNTQTYCPDGYGGPFYICGFEGDMRKIELWYQLGYYLEEKFL